MILDFTVQQKPVGLDQILRHVKFLREHDSAWMTLRFTTFSRH